ncbi:aKG-HExxH-type peptide beta-hydroxylase [Pseudonocardia sp. CA-142604]|uniref:aKG-HExxH-type peptide beta-hydroxylase n=1 Tax=Pseudonocardia sp. CA-142604 TaxID=3240024 RepID=UPI003D8E560E
MPLGVAELQRAHALFGAPDEVIAQRRALYAALLELFSDDMPLERVDDMLDSPAVRGHLGAVLAGDTHFVASRCCSIDELVDESCKREIEGCVVRLASSVSAREGLADAVLRISDELQQYGADAPRATLVTTADRPDMGALFGLLVKGIELAVHLVPALALDLLPHVSLFAILARDASDRLGSASAREFPGLVLIPEPRSPLEVAEALIHEGAHQKFFDLATTRALFGEPSDQPPQFSPSWAPAGAPSWPIEQTFAAWHAYCCLSVVRDSLGTLSVHEDSLLPRAEQRRVEIGEWLLAHGDALGRDGHAFLGAMLDRRPAREGTDTPVDVARSVIAADESSLVRRVGERTLVVTRSSPVELLWLHSDVLDASARREL